MNSQDYKAQGIALDWWRHNGYNIRDGVVDIIDAYADGVIYGWNNPQWIPVEERLPEEGQVVLIYTKGGDVCVTFFKNGVFNCSPLFQAINVTHWMPIVPPRKED